MSELTTNLNWIAVFAGTILSFLIGWLWYSSRLFGTKWADGNGISLANGVQPMPVIPLVLQLVATFFLAWLIGVTAANEALMTAFLALITITLLIAANGVFAKKFSAAVWIESSFIIVMGVVMIACHAVL